MQLGLTLEYPGTSEEYGKPFTNERRFHHTWFIGKTGQGKSTALINSAIADILNGEGIAFFDPHGNAVEEIKKHIPPEKVILKEYSPKQIVLFDPSDKEFPVGFNPLHNASKEEIPFIASTIVDTVRSAWKLDDVSIPYIELYVYFGCAALLEVPDGSLVGLEKLLTDDRYRKEVMSFVKDDFVRKFWEFNFEEVMPDKEQRTTTLSTLNKITQLIADPRIRNILGQPESTIDFKDIMDNGKCLLISLPQGKLGLNRSSLIGALLMSQLHLTALRRTSTTPFHIYADEAHRFGTSTLEEMLSGIRKFNVSLALAHQYLDQLTTSLQSALLGTVGTIVSFRVGVKDAEVLSQEIGVEPRDLIGLKPYTAWVRTDNIQERKVVSMADYLFMPDIDFPVYEKSPKMIRQYSRLRYATKRSQVERRINKFIRHT